MVSILNYTNMCACICVLKRKKHYLTSCKTWRALDHFYHHWNQLQKDGKNIHTSILNNLFLINWDKLNNIHHTRTTPFTCWTLSSLCFKQSVNKTFFTPFFARVFRRFCRAHVRFGFRKVPVVLEFQVL